MRILVCGGRDFRNKKLLYDTLIEYCYKEGLHHPRDAMSPDPNKVSIISGMARGADSLGWLFAKDHNLEVFSFPADWKHQSNGAGPIRNQKMLDEGKPDLVIAFPTKNSKGTWDMVRRAEKANVKTIIVREDDNDKDSN